MQKKTRQDRRTVFTRSVVLTIALFGSVGFGVGCIGIGKNSETLTSTEASRGDKFGIIEETTIRNWSALWEMSKAGSVRFCIKGTTDMAMLADVQSSARYAVNQWVKRLNQSPPNSSYPSWNYSFINTSFGCTGSYYTVKVNNEGVTECDVFEKLIDLDLEWVGDDNTLAHEFGHAMGLPDTYDEDDEDEGLIAGQVVSIMFDAGPFTEDDYYAIWALWKYLNTGKLECGPGYTAAGGGNLDYDYLCRPGQGGSGSGYNDDGSYGGNNGGGNGGSCAGKCGEFFGNNVCNCDDQCSAPENDDCCPGYQNACGGGNNGGNNGWGNVGPGGGGGSCKGYCLSINATPSGCYCDDLCYDNLDGCCSDFDQLCR